MLIHLAVLAGTVLVLSLVMPDVHINGVGTAIAVAIVFSLLNFFIGWLIQLLLIVPALLTFGLLFLVMTFIVNTVLLWLTDKLMASFEITTTRGLLVSSGAITVVNWLLHTHWVWREGSAVGPRWI
jgi:putative membrane protein